MKKYLKFIIGACLLFNASDLRANIYRIDFSYGSDLGGDNAGLAGFMYIDSSLDTGNQLTTDNPAGYTDGSGGLPDWITAVQLTFDPTPLNTGNGDEIVKTRSTFRLVRWDLKTDGSFDVTSDFVPQMNGFGFVSTDADSSYGIGQFTLEQDFQGFNTVLNRASRSEFALESTTTTPGELPLLGFGALIYYYKKIKNKNSLQ